MCSIPWPCASYGVFWYLFYENDREISRLYGNMVATWPMFQTDQESAESEMNTLRFFYFIYLNQSLQWRHNERDGASNQQRLDCLRNRLFRRRSKKTSKLRVTGLCEGNPPVTGGFSSQRASNVEMFPFDDVNMVVSTWEGKIATYRQVNRLPTSWDLSNLFDIVAVIWYLNRVMRFIWHLS